MFKNLKLILKGLIRLSSDPDFLFKLFKDLQIHAPIYVDEMTDTNEPETFVLIERFNFDKPSIQGDGISLYRDNDFTIRFYSKSPSVIRNLYKLYSSKLNNHIPAIPFDYNGPIPDPTDKVYSAQLIGRYPYVF